ncbi:iron-sulfur cluster-binding domain-containing protein [Flavobacterium sp. MR2016-29]|uniref:flavin reductase family protein n=1 Tax=Flavobacterium sp. MR2016-29 TaxID=2783795 RepID=UPI00188B6C6E|nr:iron-sulfur cluster-binding domain-containing protein [Flavobacterium sp. MR2016-29]MBF4492912.1 iron-sulfur cluster-binding domain-containing protein [Flavobacterium sp. MR2016-29]
MKNYTLKVQEVRKETDDTVTICFKQPGLKKIKYFAGQYLTLQFRINGRRYIRPYSFSSSPLIDSSLNVTIKRVPRGIVSNYINDHIKVDDVIEVQEPLGDFIFHDDNDLLKSVMFWGVGSGITPLFSMIKELLIVHATINIFLVYGNKSKKSVIFYNELEKLRLTYSDRFKIYYFYSKEEFFDDESHNFRGRINSNFVSDLVKKNIEPTRHYVCGPIGLKNIIKESLLNLSGNLDNLFSEDFEIIKNPEDFKAILDQEITLSFQGNQNKIVINKGNSILEEALEAGLELPYSCQTGNCSTCKATLKSGELKMIGLSKPRTDLNENEYLLCCSYPVTNNVCVEI